MDFSLENAKDLVTIATSLVLPAILYVLNQIRGHLKRIEKIEKDVNEAHRFIRELRSGKFEFDDEDSELCGRCPLVKAEE